MILLSTIVRRLQIFGHNYFSRIKGSPSYYLKQTKDVHHRAMPKLFQSRLLQNKSNQTGFQCRLRDCFGNHLSWWSNSLLIGILILQSLGWNWHLRLLGSFVGCWFKFGVGSWFRWIPIGQILGCSQDWHCFLFDNWLLRN